jgi:hypothetical protein
VLASIPEHEPDDGTRLSFAALRRGCIDCGRVAAFARPECSSESDPYQRSIGATVDGGAIESADQ